MAGGRFTLTREENKKLSRQARNKESHRNKKMLVPKGLTALKKEAIVARNDLTETWWCSRESEGTQLY